jgi:hypothetical protein
MAVYTFNSLIGGGAGAIAGKAVAATHVLRAFENSLALKQGDQAHDQMRWARVADTSTGVVNNFALSDICALLTFAPATQLTITGITGGRDGRMLQLHNLGTAAVLISCNSASSLAINRITTESAIGQWLGVHGSALLYHDGTNWWLELISPGKPITPAFVAGDYTNGWGALAAGTVTTCTFRQWGTVLEVSMLIDAFPVAGGPIGPLQRLIPGGFTTLKANYGAGGVVDNGAQVAGLWAVGAASTILQFYSTMAAGLWATTAAGSALRQPNVRIHIT